MYEVSVTLVAFHLLTRGLHAPRHRIEFRGYPSICEQNICFVRKGLPFTGYPSICKENICSIRKGIPSNIGILSSLIPFSYTDGCQTSHISFAETYPIPKVFLPKQTRVHAPWVSVMATKLLAFFRWKDSRLI